MFDEILRIVLLILALLGGGAFLYRKFSMRVELIPITVFSMVIFVLFVAGILNLLKPATLLLLVTGLCLLVYSIAGAGLKPWKLRELLTPGTIFLLCGIVYFSFFFIDAKLITYDSFSHWALIVKQMLYDNRLPNFQNDLIMFQSYPPGSALFLYFVTKTIGPSEGRMMFAQTLLILGGLTTLFSFVDQRLTLGKKVVMTLLITASSLVLLTMDTYLYDLPVDTLLPVCALAGLVSIVQIVCGNRPDLYP